MSRSLPLIPGLAPSVGGRRPRFRNLLVTGDPVVLPGVGDVLTARLVERAGFPACYVSGAGFANAQLGLPDVGLTSRDEMVTHIRRIVDGSTVPVVADGDTGFGGPTAVMRTVHLFEGAGAQGIQLEDQRMPKRCGHFDGKSLVPPRDMIAKLDAAKKAASDHFVVIARTDARTVEGLPAALQRVQLYADAGADAVFVESPLSVKELEEIPRAVSGIPLLVNVVEGGLTPELSVADYHKMGYTIILYANFLMRVMAKSAQLAIEHLRSHGETHGYAEQMLSWEERQELVNLGAMETLDAYFHSDSVNLDESLEGR